MKQTLNPKNSPFSMDHNASEALSRISRDDNIRMSNRLNKESESEIFSKLREPLSGNSLNDSPKIPVSDTFAKHAKNIKSSPKDPNSSVSSLQKDPIMVEKGWKDADLTHNQWQDLSKNSLETEHIVAPSKGKKTFTFFGDHPDFKTEKKPNKMPLSMMIIGGVFLVVLFGIIILMSYIYASDSSDFKTPQSAENKTLLPQKTQKLSEIENYFKAAQESENQGDFLSALQLRLSGVESYIALKEFQVALDAGQEIDQIFKSRYPQATDATVNELLIYHHNFMGEIFYNLNNMEKAIIHSRKSLSLALQYLQHDRLRIVHQYHIMALHLENIGDFDQALEMRSAAIDITIKSKKPIDEGNLITEMSNLGDEYRTLGHLNKAENILRKAIFRIEDRFGIDAPELIIVLNNLGLTLNERNHKTFALSYLQQAYLLCIRHYGKDHNLAKNIAQNIKRIRTE